MTRPGTIGLPNFLLLLERTMNALLRAPSPVRSDPGTLRQWRTLAAGFEAPLQGPGPIALQ
jgi:hypothetical protein